MTGGFSTASMFTGGGYISNIYIATPAIYTFLSKQANLDIESTKGLYSFNTLDGLVSYIIESDPSVFQFLANNSQIMVTTEKPNYEFIAKQLNIDITSIGSVYTFNTEEAELGLNTDIPQFQFIGVEADSFATGETFIDTELATFIFNAVDADSDYDVDINRLPDFVVNKIGTDAEIKVRNLQNTPVSIFKADDTKANFYLLTITTDFPYIDSNIDGEVKYKVAFSFVGEKGGEEINIIGQKTDSRLIADYE